MSTPSSASSSPDSTGGTGGTGDPLGGPLVVVGASLAGLRAVETARRLGYAGELVLVGAEPHPPYDRPPLSKAVLAPDGDGEVAPFHPVEHLERELDVRLLLGRAATGLDPDRRIVRVGDDELAYGALVVATGAAPRPFPGVDPADPPRGVRHLRTLEDALAVRAALEEGARTVVVGAGFIGSEVASAARGRGLPVTVVEAAPVPLQRSVGPEVGGVLTDLHRAHGTQVRLGAGVAGLVVEDGRVTGVRLAADGDPGAGSAEEGELLPADLVVLGTGVAPATGWLEGSGVPLHPGDRGVVADATGHTGVGGVWAAGDVVHLPQPLRDGAHERFEHWTSAADHGAAVVRNLLDPAAAQPIEGVPYFWSDLYGRRLQFVGTPHADEVRVVHAGGAGAETASGFLALYRREDRLVGAFAIDRPREVMKYRRRVASDGAWDEALAFATGG